jgi:hypothetical protein
LAAQAVALDSIFHDLARRSAANMGQYVEAAETYMRLALKAQAQSRATMETLAEIKNPRQIAFVGQANVAHGPQQVNNGPTPQAPVTSRAENSKNAPNELLEKTDGDRLDPITASCTVSGNISMETVGTSERAENTRR